MKNCLIYDSTYDIISYVETVSADNVFKRKERKMANRELMVRGRLTNLADREFQNDDGTKRTSRMATLVFDKGEFMDSVNEIQKAVKESMVEEFGKIVKPSRKFMKDGDTETREDNDPKSETFGETVLISDSSVHLQNSYYITNINADKLVMYNTHQRVISWEDFLEGDQDIYVGCYVQAKLNLSTYSNKFGIQVSKYLNAIALLRDGEPIRSFTVDRSADGFEFSKNGGSVDDKPVSASDFI